MTDQFSRDQPGPRPRFRPGPGQLGEHAALNLQRGQGRQERRAQPQRQRRQTQAAGLGLPPRQEEAPDDRHLLFGLRHTNIQNLGRDIPFGLWALHNGYFPELAPGQPPYDWLD